MLDLREHHWCFGFVLVVSPPSVENNKLTELRSIWLTDKATYLG